MRQMKIAYKWTNEYCLKRDKVKLLKSRQMKVAYIEKNEVDCNETNEIAYKCTNEYCLNGDKVKLLKKTN